jgi:hypothetical protein
MLGSSAIMVSYFSRARSDRKELGICMVLFASILDFVASSFFALGPIFIPDEGWDDNEDPSGACVFQGFMVQFSLCAVCWSAVMAVNFYALVVRRTNARYLRKLLKYEFALLLFSSTIVALVALGLEIYGDAGLWCWIANDFPYHQLGFFYTFVVISWAISIYCLVAVQGVEMVPLIATGHPQDSSDMLDMSARTIAAKEEAHTAAKESTAAVRSRLSKYIFIFILIWIFGLSNRIVGTIQYETQSFDPVYILIYLHALLVPLQGFFNMLIYFGWVDDALAILSITICRRCNTPEERTGASSATSSHQLLGSLAAAGGWTHKDLSGAGLPLKDSCTINPHRQPTAAEEQFLHFFESSGSDNNSSDNDENLERSNLHQHSLSESCAKKTIFTSTFNVGESRLQMEDIAAWLPLNFDLYAIGVQECVYLSELRELILLHLNHNGDDFVLFTQELGSVHTSMGFHGMIALSIFVRRSDLDSGHVAIELKSLGGTNSMGPKLPGGLRAPNKGTAGLSLRYFDSTLAFITAHLASDSGGKLRFEKRNEQANELLAASNLFAADNLSCDVHHCHHHTFVFGDLNFRIADFFDPQDIVSLVHSTCIAERSSMEPCGFPQRQHQFSLWRETRWLQLTSVASNLLNGANEKVSVVQKWKDRKHHLSEERWVTLLEHDELRRARTANVVFSGFHELPVSFPPTFRRRRGPAGSPGDYSNRDQVSMAYVVDLSFVVEDADESVDDDDRECPAAGLSEANLGSGTTEAMTNLGNESTSPAEEHPATNKPSIDLSCGVRRAKARPPSYTDRIMVHSLQDRECRLSLEAYDSTDAITMSDHRPVALASVLHVSSEEKHSFSVWVRLNFLEVDIEPPFDSAKRKALYATPYYTAPIEEKPTTKRVVPIIGDDAVDYDEGKESHAQKKKPFNAGSSNSEATISSHYDLFGQHISGGNSLYSHRHRSDSSDDFMAGFMDRSETIELIFPLPSEDPLLEERTLAGAAREGVAVGRKAAVKKIRKQVYARAGAAAAAGAAEGEGRSQAPGTVVLKRDQVLSSTSAMKFKDFVENAKALETVSEVTPGLGMHAVVKFVDSSGNVLAQGSLCLATVAQKHILNAHTASNVATGLSTGLTKAPTPVEVDVVVSAGGRRLGKVLVGVTCEQVSRIL